MLQRLETFTVSASAYVSVLLVTGDAVSSPSRHVLFQQYTNGIPAMPNSG